MNVRVIVTRPEREAQQWGRDLSALGLQTEILALIKITPIDNAAALVQAWHDLPAYAGVMFVSGNAVVHFFAAKPPQLPAFGAQSSGRPRAWATGPGTARALAGAGVAPERVDAPAPKAGQFDSEALWQVVAAQVGGGDRVLIVRGADAPSSADAAPGSGRDWFAKRVSEAGARAEFVLAYQRCVPDFGPAQQALARRAAGDGSVWLFSSAQAVANLRTCLPDQSWSGARALATHPRIAAAAKSAGFGCVWESRPTLSDVVASLESIQ